MKRKLVVFVILMMCGIGFAQETEQPTTNKEIFKGKRAKVLTLGLGITEHYTFYPENGTGPKGRTSPLYGSLTLQMEFGIHKYVGVGGYLGVEYANNLSRRSLGVGVLTGFGIYSNSSFQSLAVPVGVFGNFHFLKLIAEKSGKSFADKMDVYAGISFGSGPAFALAKSGFENLGNDTGFILHGGPHVGIRYYPKSRIGVYAEAGYGKSYLNGGLSLSF
jgi:hypothetical protein